MGRPVVVASVGSMRLVLCWALVYLSTAPCSVTATELDIYPVHTDIDTEEEKRLNENSAVGSLSEPEVGAPGTDKPEEDVVAGERGEAWPAEASSEASEPQSDDVSYVFKRILARDDKDFVLIAVIAAGCAAAAAGVVALSIGWYKLHANSKAAADIEYPAYGVTGPNKEITPTGDRRLAQSAQMYHYQHQKQQIIAMESNRANNERRGSVSEGDSDEENEEGDYTVYECPGLAATGELEVKNPLFLDDPTPASGNHIAEEPAVPADIK